MELNSFGDGCASIALQTAVMAADSARVGNLQGFSRASA